MTNKAKERKLDMYCKSVEECAKCKFFNTDNNTCQIEEKGINWALTLPPVPYTRADVLDKAKQCVTSDRESQYGSPEDNFKLIADFWQSYLKGRSVPDGVDLCILPQDVAVMMALLKIARIKTGTFKEDSFVDACGYLACAAELAKE